MLSLKSKWIFNPKTTFIAKGERKNDIEMNEFCLQFRNVHAENLDQIIVWQWVVLWLYLGF